MPTDSEWTSLNTPPSELRLHTTLFSGQSFTWTETSTNEWTNVIDNTMVTLKQTDTDVFFKPPSAFPSLHSYFQLPVSASDLYDTWSSTDPNFKKRASGFPGIRLLRQDPVENLFSFICSSNNNISRITGMVKNLSIHYGAHLGTVGGLEFYSFPTVEALCVPGVEQKLRELGFGYRAKFIAQAASYIHTHKGGASWLYSLREMEYENAKEELLGVMGVGPKVADCVLLMSLDKLAAIPVDTHVLQIAVRDYGMKQPKTKSMTPTLYKDVQNLLGRVWGDFAGWAQAVVFTAEVLGGKEEGKSPPEKKVKKEENVVKMEVVESPLGKRKLKEEEGTPSKRKVKKEIIKEEMPSDSAEGERLSKQIKTRDSSELAFLKRAQPLPSFKKRT
ncbi:8-oxoguanine glycosylase ogg1 [Chytridiales sp. JEL 0842]|nr:8-oxoguanine glycosylase ogg1 [Chytridiales sp. JEL 0842]